MGAFSNLEHFASIMEAYKKHRDHPLSRSCKTDLFIALEEAYLSLPQYGFDEYVDGPVIKEKRVQDYINMTFPMCEECNKPRFSCEHGECDL